VSSTGLGFARGLFAIPGGRFNTPTAKSLFRESPAGGFLAVAINGEINFDEGLSFVKKSTSSK
jgi:hypothetical protein